MTARGRWVPLLVGTLLLAACSANSSSVSPTTTNASPTGGTPPAASPGPADPTTAEPTASVEPAATCRATVDAMSTEQQVGQVFMVAVTNADTPDPTAVSIIADNEIGSVLLLGNTTAGAEHVKGFTDAIRQVVGDDVLITVDQEGGVVQRLQGPGFEVIPDAVEQATMPNLEDAAKVWGDELRAAGVDVNLAPVADVVPTDRVSSNAPVGQLRRGYGSDPAQVSASVTAFIAGMKQARMGTAAKHYPGLGRVVGNPDFADQVIDNETTRDDPSLAPFGAAIEAGVPMVMISSATYTEIDADHQAVFSTIIVQEMLRGDLGFDGVVVSDDLGVAANLSATPVAERGWRFIRAGGDLVINADPAKAATMVDGVVAEMTRDPEFADQVAASATRVMVLKQELGRVTCE